MSIFNRINVNGFEFKNSVQVIVREIVVADLSQVVNAGEIKVLFLCKIQNLPTLGCGQEFSLVVKELKSVPLARIV